VFFGISGTDGKARKSPGKINGTGGKKFARENGADPEYNGRDRGQRTVEIDERTGKETFQDSDFECY